MAEKDKSPSYTVPSCKEPSYLNSSTLVGFTAGAMTANPFAALFGAVVGALIGKKKMVIEQAKGKKVEAPSMWNKGAFMGFAVTIIAFGAGAGIGGILGVAALSAFSAWVGGKIVHSMQEKAYNAAREHNYMYGAHDPDKVKEQPCASPALEQSQQQNLAPPQQAIPPSITPSASLQDDATEEPCVPAPDRHTMQERIRRMERSGAVGSPYR